MCGSAIAACRRARHRRPARVPDGDVHDDRRCSKSIYPSVITPGRLSTGLSDTAGTAAPARRVGGLWDAEAGPMAVMCPECPASKLPRSARCMGRYDRLWTRPPVAPRRGRPGPWAGPGATARAPGVPAHPLPSLALAGEDGGELGVEAVLGQLAQDAGGQRAVLAHEHGLGLADHLEGAGGLGALVDPHRPGAAVLAHELPRVARAVVDQ